MAANIEQIFQDFILNKIREIEDQHGDNGPAEDPEPRGDDGEVAQRASAEPHAQGGEAAGEPQHKHKKHKKHKSKKRKKKKKRKKGTGDEEEDEEESSTESGAESDGGGAKHQSSVAVPGQVNEEQDQDDKSKRHKGHASAKKKKKKRRKDAEKSSSDSDSESGSKHKEGGSSARHREALPDIIPKQDGSKKGGGGGERDGRARHRSRSRSRSHSRSARRGHRSRSRSRRRRSRTRSRSRSRHRRRSRTASRSRSSRSRSARRSRRSRSRSPRRRRSRSKTQSPSRRRRSPSRDRGSGSNKDKSTADVVRVKEERVASSPPVVKEERMSPPPHSDSTAAEALKTAGGWKPLPLLDVNSTTSSSEKKGASDGSAQSSEVSSKGPLSAVTKELTEASTEPPQSADQRSNGSKTGREEQKAEDTKERAGSKRGTSSATSQSSPTRSGSREKDRSAATGSSRPPRAPEDPTATAGKAKSPPAKKRTRASKSPVSQKKKDGKSSSKKKKKSKSRSQSRSRKKKSRSRSRSPSRRKRSRTKSRSRSPSRRSRRSRSRSGSRGRRRGAYSLSQRDRWKREPSHSPVLILRKNRSPPRKKRSNSKSPSRITELDKEQLLEIAKANAAAMCAKAGMPIPDNLRPRMPPQQPMPMPLPAMAMNAALASMTAATMTAALSGMGALASLPPLPSITNKPPPGPPQQNLAALEEVKRKVAKQANSISIKEFTEKCKMIVDSKGELPVAKPHVSDEEDEGKPFGGSALKETKAISFSIGNMSVRPAVRSDAGMAKEFPVSSGSQHRKKEGDTPSAYGDWVPVEKQTADKTKASAVAAAAASAGSKAAPAVPAATTAPSSGEAASATVAEPTFVPATDSVFPEPPQQPVDISQAVTERIKAQRRLAENPYDVSAICMLSRAQEQVDAWAQSNTIPGLFTGSTGAQVLSSEELSNSGPQAWLKKDQFLRAAPVSGGVGEFLMRKMGWRTGEGLGRNREGTVEPIIIDFKIDRKGLVAEGEKPLKQTGGLVVTKDLMGKHPVSALIELCNKKRIMQPDFVMVHHSGPDHRKNFLFKVTVNGVDHQPQSASPNKKHAKAMAATVALQAMGEVPADGPGLYTGPVFTAASTGPLFST